MNSDVGKNEIAVVTKVSATPTLTIDWEFYGKHLDASDLSDADKQAFIETLWSIVVSFVDLGFGVHPVQHVCGQEEELRDLITAKTDAVVTSKDNSKTEFNTAADKQSGLPQGRSSK